MRVALTLAILFAASPAVADSVVELRYAGSCDERALRDEVATFAGRDPFERDAPVLTVTVEPVASGLRATVTHGETRRTIDSASCATLVPELALIIATVMAQSVPAIAPQAPVALPDTTVRERVRETVPEPAPGPARRYDVLVGGAVTDARHVVGSLGARLVGRRLSLAIEIAVSRFSLEDDSIRFARDVAVLVPCVRAARLSGCATLEAGLLRSRGERYLISHRVSSPHAALGFRIAIEQPLGTRFTLGSQIDLRTAMTSQRLLVDDMQVWSSPRMEASLGVYASARIP